VSDEGSGRGVAHLRRVLPVLWLLAFCQLDSPLVAQILEGRVLRGDSTPVAEVLVELHRITADSGTVVDSARTGADGAFRFAIEVKEDPGAVYLAGARYAGILYWGPALHGGGAVPDAGTGSLAIAVYDTMAVNEPVRELAVGMRHIVVTPGGAGLQVDEMIDVKGSGGRTVVSAIDSVPVWRGSLAQDAHGAIPAATEISPQDVLLRGTEVGLLRMLPPTGARIAISYVITSLDFVLSIEHATDRLEVLVVDVPGLEVDASGVQPASTTSVDTGVSMHRFTASRLSSGQTIRLAMRIAEPGSRRAWPWFVVGVVLAVAALMARRLIARTP
jgi:hypothetical protein